MGKEIQPGDLVIRLSYGGDLIFQVIWIDENKQTAFLRGRDIRLMADAPLADLALYIKEKKNQNEQYPYQKLAFIDYDKRVQRRSKTKPVFEQQLDDYGQILGTVLHLDGDKSYLEKCLSKYDELKINANGYYIDEEEQPAKVQALLNKHLPDVLVITGHDGMRRSGSNDLADYHSSRYFIESVKKARELVPDKDALVIFAGACQSYYEALIQAGANFASSPNRINIHTLDPVKVVEVIVQTSVKEIVSAMEVIQHSISGIEGIGGIESRGKMRLSLPKI